MAKADKNTVAYRHPETEETWSGQGKQPAWIKAALENGRHLSDFAVEPDIAATSDPIGTTVRLIADLTLGKKKHPHAGQLVKVVGEYGQGKYSVETTDQSPGNIYILQPSDWEPATTEPGTPAATPAIAAQLQTINLYTDPAQNEVRMVPLDLIDDSPFQPRTHYADDYIAGLSASMRAVGMVSAMLIRPKGDRFEQVFGHCRKRGAIGADMKEGPAIVRELNDAEAAQLQAVENLQREDLDAIDEAMSFAAYIKAHGCTKDEFCALTGLSRTQVYNRLKLSTLMPAGQQAMRDGLIKAEVATMIARVPGDKQQAYALKIILDNSTKHPDEPDEVMTVARARAFLREKFTLDLKTALWKLNDDTLLDADYAVACTVCPKRSGVDPIVYVDLLGDQRSWSRTPGGENVCTDPECFDKKKTAHLKREQAALEAKGEVVIAGNKARQTISAEGNLKNGYVALKDVKAELTRISKEAKASGTEAPAVEIVTVQNPRDGKTIKAVKVATLQEAGGKVEEPATGRNNSAKNEAEQKAKEEKAEADTAFYKALFLQVRTAASQAPRTTLDLQLIATRLFEYIDWSDKKIIAEAQGHKDDHAGISKLEKSIGSMDAPSLAMLLLDCVLTEDLEVDAYWIDRKPEALLKAAKQYGVDVKASRKAHDAALKAQADAPAAAEADAEHEEEEQA